jgi:DNA-binding transcriptional MocR family regulator
VAPPALIEDLWRHRDYTTLMVSRLSDRLGTLALEPSARERILQRTRGLIREGLEVVDAWVGRRPEVLSLVPPLAGAIAYVEYDLPVASRDLIERLRVERSVLLVAGDQVGLGKGFRIGFGYDREKLSAGLDVVGEALDEVAATAGSGP